MAAIEITFPESRWVQGDIWKGQTRDMDGFPLVFKTGADAGKPRQNYFFAVAIPKRGEVHWNQTPWGATIWNTGVAGFPAAAQRPNFAWKVIDGDSQTPNEKGKVPAQQEGFAGHWVLRFTGAFAPEVGQLNGGRWAIITDPNAIKCGDWIQVKGTVEFNGNSNKPGVYMNHTGVKFHAPGEYIRTGNSFDGASAGFSDSQAGAPVGGPSAPPPAATPSYTMTAKANGLTRDQFLGNGWSDAQLLEQGMMVAAATVVPAPFVTPAAPVPPSAGVGAAMPPSATAYAPPVGVGTGSAPPPSYQPHPGFTAGAAAPPPVAAPPVVAPPPAAPVRQMTAAANGATYEQMTAAGWTDALLIQHGMMVG